MKAHTLFYHSALGLRVMKKRRGFYATRCIPSLYRVFTFIIALQRIQALRAVRIEVSPPAASCCPTPLSPNPEFQNPRTETKPESRKSKRESQHPKPDSRSLSHARQRGAQEKRAVFLSSRSPLYESKHQPRQLCPTAFQSWGVAEMAPIVKFRSSGFGVCVSGFGTRD